jgi:hypothetical protein
MLPLSRHCVSRAWACWQAAPRSRARPSLSPSPGRNSAAPRVANTRPLAREATGPRTTAYASMRQRGEVLTGASPHCPLSSKRWQASRRVREANVRSGVASGVGRRRLPGGWPGSVSWRAARSGERAPPRRARLGPALPGVRVSSPRGGPDPRSRRGRRPRPRRSRGGQCGARRTVVLSAWRTTSPRQKRTGTHCLRLKSGPWSAKNRDRGSADCE